MSRQSRYFVAARGVPEKRCPQAWVATVTRLPEGAYWGLSAEQSFVTKHPVAQLATSSPASRLPGGRMEVSEEHSEEFWETYRRWNGVPTGLRCPNPQCPGDQVWRYSFEFHQWFRGCTNFDQCRTAMDYWNQRLPQYRAYRRAPTGCLIPLVIPLLGLVPRRTILRKVRIGRSKYDDASPPARAWRSTRLRRHRRIPKMNA
jgi:hypothetical protein